MDMENRSDSSNRKGMGRLTLAIVCVFVASVVIGCSAPGELVIHQAPETALQMSKVIDAGDYGLFRAGDQQPLLEFSLKAGDRLGFEKASDGSIIWLYGIAGNNRNRLEVDKTYEWRRL